MNYKHVIICIISWCILGHSVAFGDDSPAVSEGEDENKDAVSSSSAAINAKSSLENIKLLLTQAGIDPSVLEPASKVLDEIIEQKKIDAHAIWKGARAIQKTFIALDMKFGTGNNSYIVDETCSIKGNDRKHDIKCLLNKTNKLTDKLRDLSYTDSLHYNKNLSYQISERFSALIDDALVVVEAIKKDESYYYAADNFIEELSLFSDKYENTARFSGGLGLTYSYIPKIIYRASSSVDFSPYQADVSGNPDRFFYTGEFNNKGFAAATLVADLPFVTINAQFPNYSEDFSVTTEVRQRQVDGIDGDVFYRTTVNSNLSIQYDVSLRISLKDLLYSSGFELTSSQADLSLGVGFIGMEVENQFLHDVRIRSEGIMPYESLANTTMLEQKQSRSFVSQYFGLNYNFILADSFMVGFVYKYHLDENQNNEQLDADGFTIGFEFTYFPFY